MKRERVDTTFGQMLSWAFYDWANSAYAAVIQTFVFAAYFVSNVATDKTEAASMWGFTIGAAGFLVAVLGPIFGSIADHGHSRKLWLAIFTALCVIATALMWFVAPEATDVRLALLLLALGTIGSEFSNIFYNAMLPNLVIPSNTGKWSGWGWGLGYIGGMGCLLLALFAFVNGSSSWFCFGKNCAFNVRAVFPLVAVWYLLFSLPLFLYTPDPPGLGKPMRKAIRDGLLQLRETFWHIRQFKDILFFLFARLFYADALATLFTFGGIYAASSFGMREHEVLLFGIGLNVTAGLGSFVFAMVDHYVGSKKVIIVSLIFLIFLIGCILFVYNYYLFWIFGLLIGIFVGPVQASSRALLANMAPRHLSNQMFGFYALTGKVTAFLGPMLVGWITFASNSQRIGLSVLLVFLVIGLILILFVQPHRVSAKNLLILNDVSLECDHDSKCGSHDKSSCE